MSLLFFQQRIPAWARSKGRLVARLVSTRAEEEVSHASPWLLAVAAVTGVLGGSMVVALCEDGNYKFDKRRVTKGIRDPMTSYEIYAEQREAEESHAQPQVQPKEETRVLQATSSLDVSPPKEPENVMTDAEQTLEAATRKAKQHSGGLKIFSGNGNMSLALDIARHLGINLGKATVGKFADGEVNVVIHENVRGKDVYVIQPTCPPVNDNIMELLLMVSTLRRASARRITVVIPYYGYARQDRKMQVSRVARM